MANHKSAIKRNKQNKKRRARNMYFISTLRTYEKKFYSAVSEKKPPEEIDFLYKKLISLFDSVADKGIIHKNKASRKVSHYTTFVNELTKEAQ